MKELKLFDKVGSFAENKDIAKEIRTKNILPNLEKNQEIVLDFENVDGATQSFIHVLISDVIRKKGIDILDRISFKNCNPVIKEIVNIVVEYMQDGEDYK